jgi:hypothetical protein
MLRTFEISRKTGAARVACIGARLAVSRLATCCVAGALGALVPGCLVTNPVDFDSDEGSPPMLLDLPTAKVPLGEHAWVDTTSGVSSWRFAVRVRDEDVTQDLQARWRVVTKTEQTPPFESLDLPFNGTLLRDFDLLLEAGQLDMGKCHRLEVVVSSGFLDPNRAALFDIPAVPGDLASGEWWIWEGPGDLAASDALKAELLDSCDALEDLLQTTPTLEAEP